MNDIARAVLHTLHANERPMSADALTGKVGVGADKALAYLLARGLAGHFWGLVFIRPAGRKLVEIEQDIEEGELK